MLGDEPVYIDADDPVIARCARCQLVVAGGRTGARDARYVIKELKRHNDDAHADWRATFPGEISAGIQLINEGAVTSGLLSGGRFEIRRFGS